MTEVLHALPEGQLDFSNSSLRRSSTSYTSFFLDSSAHLAASRKNNYSHSDLRSDSVFSSQSCSFRSTPSTSSFDTTSMLDDEDDEDDENELVFPSYSTGPHTSAGVKERPPSPVIGSHRPPPSPADEVLSIATPPPEHLPISEDDTAVRQEPSHHVDYLSHEWREEEIWSSWRHIVSQRRVYGERSRLENASWRTWAKSQFKLDTVSPETLNWLKDVDVTWLYGPLQPPSNTYSQQTSEPASRLSKTNSFLHKKPILKKRSVSEVMLQKSISTSSLVKQAAASVQAQQAGGSAYDRRRRPQLAARAMSDFGTSSIPSQTVSRDATDYFSSQSSSGLHTPDHGERKHIRFDDKVEQCIAVDCKDGDYDDDDDNDNWPTHDDSDSSEEGVVMMKKSRRKKPLSRTNSRSSFSGESKTIAKLPSTTLKYRTDSPDLADQLPTHSLGFWRSSRLSPSPSQETLRPSNPSANFLLPEEDEEEDDELAWQPSGAYQTEGSNSGSGFGKDGQTDRTESEGDLGGLRRTESGMFMPYDGEDDDPIPPGILGKVYDTVNTARDIAHVIWNVGWRS